ncbi:MAG: ATP-binding cassette domain-containing protein [Spirochaetota bacterium]
MRSPCGPCGVLQRRSTAASFSPPPDRRGAGKTTLLNLIGCLERPDAGSITIDGVRSAEMSRDDLAHVRRE